MKKLFFIIIITLVAITVFPQKKAFTIEDVYKIKGVSSLSISPDGSKIAFVVSESNLEEVSSTTNIYLMNPDGTGLKQLTHSGANYNPFWGSDGKALYFVSTRNGSSQLYSMSFDGGDPVQLTDYALGVSSPKLASGGDKIIFAAKVYPECGADAQCNEKISTFTKEGPIHAHIADSLFVRHWTEYEDGQYEHVLMLDLQSQEVTDLTPGYFNSPAFSLGGSDAFTFSPDGEEVSFDCYVICIGCNHWIGFYPSLVSNLELSCYLNVIINI